MWWGHIALNTSLSVEAHHPGITNATLKAIWHVTQHSPHLLLGLKHVSQHSRSSLRCESDVVGPHPSQQSVAL